MSENYTIEKDLKEAEAMAKALTPYVHDQQLYGNVGGGGFFSAPTMPSLTLGALLMRLRRLSVLSSQMTAAQIERLKQADARNQAVYQEWRVHYQNKLVREAHSRLDAMQTFFEECAQDERLCARVYKPEASRRTIVEEILMAMGELGIEDKDLTTKVRGTDSRLHRYLQPGDFLWSQILTQTYPQGQFWWLYQQPPER